VSEPTNAAPDPRPNIKHSYATFQAWLVDVNDPELLEKIAVLVAPAVSHDSFYGVLAPAGVATST